MSDSMPQVEKEVAGEAKLRAETRALRAYARAVSSAWRTVRDKKPPLHFLGRLEEVEAAFVRVNAALGGLGPKSSSALRELKENPRLLRSALTGITSMRRHLQALPRVDGGPRVAALARGYFEAARSAWDKETQRTYVEAAQQRDPLELQEVWALPSFLKFELLELVLHQAAAMLRWPHPAALDEEADDPELLATRMRSLRGLEQADWTSLLEPLVGFDAILRQDPAGAYAAMDFEGREDYRKRVAEFARHSNCTETQVAEIVLGLAREARARPEENPRLHRRHAHIGYYLVDRGIHTLHARIGYHPPLIDRVRWFVRRNPDDFYIVGIEVVTVLLIAAILLPLIPNNSIIGGLTFAFILLLLPATQAAVDFLNNTVTSLFQASALPKLDFSEGIPVEYTTLVAVPTMLMREQQVRELAADLEIRFLANPDPNLHFALLTDLPDSVSRPREDDRDPLVDLAVSLIDDLNQRYPASPKHGSFFLFHRHRVFNARQGVWMGWERKRGKLLDLNKYLRGDFDAFPVKAGDLAALSRVEYVITLDSDTQLPRGTAAAMAGTMAHPLNRAIIDPRRRIVTAGYGILQPRVGVSVHSALASRLAALYAGQTGLDIYTHAVSDVYQDLYGEGSFTGKGIYEVNVLHSVLERRFPRNALLSHDLIEGAYARAGLATDIEVIDDYPSHYSAYTRRQHRWVRGDWQIAQWLFARVPDESGRSVRNPISTISRWKIFDNLRRSLVEPLTLILLVAGWLGLPGGPLYWTLVTVFLLLAPTLVQLGFGLGRALFSEAKGGLGETLGGFWHALFPALLNLAFLPHQTMFLLDAIIRSLVRRFVTGQRLLEWETAAEAESSKRKTTPVDRYLAASSIFAVAVAIVLAATRLPALKVAGPILLLWGFANGISIWLNHPPREEHRGIGPRDEAFLRRHALRVWRFFREFGGASHNFLVPDNLEEATLFEAARVSPTNFGLLLNARQAAVEFGFLTVPEFCVLTRASFASMDRLAKLRGHLFNWYDTRTLEPHQPATVSSVDSGNLAASLYTLRTGANALLRAPLLSPALFRGLDTHWQLLKLQESVPREIAGRALPGASAKVPEWVAWVFETLAMPAVQAIPEYAGPSHDGAAWWLSETRARLRSIASLLTGSLPWLLPEFEALGKVDDLKTMLSEVPTIEDAAAFAETLDARLVAAPAQVEDPQVRALAEKLRSRLPTAHERLKKLVESLNSISLEAFRKAEAMDFSFLVNQKRQLLSIGYEVVTKTLHEACYDMLASEARIATFIAVARGELSQKGWFRMGRGHTLVFGDFILLSWTGTMFEYLMPSLWMRSYPHTLIERTLSSAVSIQCKFAHKMGIPWGISESGYGKTDEAGHYQYRAFGIPQTALKWDAEAGPVISPYSTFLALGTAPAGALQNLRRMDAAGWVGSYGFYEAADFAASKKKPVLIREWMAHHQGMALLAILNLLEKNVVQEWFHANLEFQASELLLHEKPVRTAVLKAARKKDRDS